MITYQSMKIVTPESRFVWEILHLDRLPIFIFGSYSVYVILFVSYRAESMSYRINEGTKQAIPKKPLSEMAWRLLNEFGKRYRIRSLYLKVCLFDYLVRYVKVSLHGMLKHAKLYV